jgi:hypothetical protein
LFHPKGSSRARRHHVLRREWIRCEIQGASTERYGISMRTLGVEPAEHLDLCFRRSRSAFGLRFRKWPYHKRQNLPYSIGKLASHTTSLFGKQAHLTSELVTGWGKIDSGSQAVSGSRTSQDIVQWKFRKGHKIFRCFDNDRSEFALRCLWQSSERQNLGQSREGVVEKY